ncbi:MAG: sulfite exporter TauE/SafE family protein [Hyphomicrobium sp.]
MFSTLGLGFLIGMQHATEVDHVAAVCSIASRKTGVSAISRHGLFWGIGHTMTLLLVGGTCIIMRTSMPDNIASRLEFAVGIMLIGLGAHVLFRLWRDRVHFHSHNHHGAGATHFHAHSHRTDGARHAASQHAHAHAERLPWRTLAVGLVHGMAGSAALVVLTAATLDSPWWGVAYILTFGIGTAAGMALLSAVIAAPITLTARSLTFANRALQVVIGIFTCAVGMRIVLETFPQGFAGS